MENTQSTDNPLRQSNG
jgi:hypothetical protein